MFSMGSIKVPPQRHLSATFTLCAWWISSSRVQKVPPFLLEWTSVRTRLPPANEKAPNVRALNLRLAYCEKRPPSKYCTEWGEKWNMMESEGKKWAILDLWTPNLFTTTSESFSPLKLLVSQLARPTHGSLINPYLPNTTNSCLGRLGRTNSLSTILNNFFLYLHSSSTIVKTERKKDTKKAHHPKLEIINKKFGWELPNLHTYIIHSYSAAK